jgi:hypothetical protein
MKIILEIEDTDLLKNISQEMIKPYIEYNLKMFKILKVKIIKTEVKK